MALENIQPINYIDMGGYSSYLPYVGVERSLARQMAAEFNDQERSIFASILRADMDDEDHVLVTPDERWIYARNSNFDLITRNDAVINLTHSQHVRELANLLGVNSSFKLSMKGTSFYFDDDGNFAKVSGTLPPDSHGEIISLDYGNFFKQQMSAGDFESVGMMLAAIRHAIEPMSTDQ